MSRHAADVLSRGPGTAVINDDTILHFCLQTAHGQHLNLRPTSENETEGGKGKQPLWARLREWR